MMMRRGALYAVVFSVLVFPFRAFGQPTETGESGLMTIPTTRTLDPGKFSIGAYIRRNIESDKTFEQSAGALRDTDITQASFMVGVGLFKGVELSVQVPYVAFQVDQPNNIDKPRDIGNVRITPKFRLFQESESTMPFSLAFLGSVELPTGSDRFPAALDRNSTYNEDVGWEIMGILDKNLFTLPGNVPVVFSLNAGGFAPGEPPTFRLDRQTEKVAAQLRRKGFPNVTMNEMVFEYGSGLQLPLWKNHIGQLDWLTEYRGNTGTIDEVDSFSAVLGGIRYMLVNGWAAQAGVDFGLTNSLNRYNLLGGISYTGPQPPPPSAAAAKEKIVYRDRVIQVEKVSFSDITFEFDKATLTDLGRGRVYLIAQKLKEGKNVKVEIQGHTDYIGTEDYNKALGLKRAEAVKAELAKLGIDPARMSTVSFGKAKPLIDQKTPWARAVNRRTEFVIVGEPEKASQAAPTATTPAE